MISETAKVIIGEVIETVKDELIEHQRAMGLRNKGISADSLRVEVASDDTSVRGQLYGSETWLIQNYGRGPNKSGKPGRKQVEALKQWAEEHGMDEGAGWAIAVKQAREGTPVPNPHNPGGVLSDVLNADNVRSKLTPRLSSAVAKDFMAKFENAK